MMKQAIKAERRKARDELQRMKEAMLVVLKKEREQLRKKFLEQNDEVQALLKQGSGGNSGAGTAATGVETDNNENNEGQ